MKNLVVKKFTESFGMLKRIYLYLLFSVGLDFLFIFIYGFSASVFVGKVEEKAVELINTAQGMFNRGFLKGLFTNNESFAIILSALVFMLAVYVNYCITQGLAWYISKKVSKQKFAKKKWPIFEYIKKFFFINIFWGMLFFILQFTDYVREVFYNLNKNKIFNEGLIPVSIYVLIIVLFYFAFISYALITRYNTIKSILRSFWIGIRHIKDVLFMYLLILIVFLIINVILALTSKISAVLMIVIGAILVLPAFIWARVFVNLVVYRLDRK